MQTGGAVQSVGAQDTAEVTAVGRPWVGAIKDTVFSFRQTWVQMPVLPLISL